MPLTLKNYYKELPKELITLAEKNIVRECDETEKGHFVAYIDEGSHSFDVSLFILAGNEIGKSTCDCKNNTTFCRHKLALLIHVAKNQKIKGPIKLKKKENKTETLLDQLDFDELKDWVKNLIEKNKDIELTFTHHFSAKKHQYTPEDVIKLIKDAIKATAGNKKNIDATQVKKLVELWADILKPVVQNYQSNVMDEKAFQGFHTMIEHCLQFQLGIQNSSTRIPKYIDGILQQSEAPVNNVLNDESWHKAAGFFVENIPDATNSVRIHYLLHLKNIIAAANDQKREKLIDLLAAQFKKSNIAHTLNGGAYTKIIFGIIETYNLLPQYYKLFKPLYFDNEFNEKLINLLIENNQLELAKKYCHDQIKNNYRDEYNLPYLTLLKEIYKLEKDETKLAETLSLLLPFSFNFDDYLFTLDRLLPEEKKKWRTKILTKARNSSYGNNKEALEFPFKLMAHEQNYKKMIEYINSYTPYDIILKYFDVMVTADKTRLLSTIIQKADSGLMSFRNDGENDNCLPGLFEIAKKYYTTDYLALVVNQVNKGKLYYYSTNRFVQFMQNQINGASK